jgi:hypothetical protein
MEAIMQRRSRSSVPHARPGHTRTRALVLFAAAACTASGVLGWRTTSVPSAQAAVPDTTSSKSSLKPARSRLHRGPLRITKLRALDMVVDLEQLKNASGPEVASLGAKKWTEMLVKMADRNMRGDGVKMSLDDYFAGWLVTTGETSPYSAAQFADSIKAELCRQPRQVRELLPQAGPALASAATGDCPLN